MELALTQTQTWCDVVFYTSKGLAIDRIFMTKNIGVNYKNQF